MAENNPVLEQRVEALEQFSQTRVVEQVGELTERVSGLESARTAETPHLASKSDIVRLEAQHTATQEQIVTLSEQFNKDLKAQSEQFSKDLKAQGDQFNTQLTAQSEQLRKEWEQRINKLISWLVASAVAVIGVGIALANSIINSLPS